ncbi:MAG: hypothetical protein COV76_01750 [Candidatus Omnitrophica bacterium CG11_big_fil_rev_8_21_14_0_20_64_10]|nr:MAG: hypothetical protein COV76_01750 [Candidatus Omnitrophica bacterium CG11_big_fil_rev_8_21_14_0_20_64_10]
MPPEYPEKEVAPLPRFLSVLLSLGLAFPAPAWGSPLPSETLRTLQLKGNAGLEAELTDALQKVNSPTAAGLESVDLEAILRGYDRQVKEAKLTAAMPPLADILSNPLDAQVTQRWIEKAQEALPKGLTPDQDRFYPVMVLEVMLDEAHRAVVQDGEQAIPSSWSGDLRLTAYGALRHYAFPNLRLPKAREVQLSFRLQGVEHPFFSQVITLPEEGLEGVRNPEWIQARFRELLTGLRGQLPRMELVPNQWEVTVQRITVAEPRPAHVFEFVLTPPDAAAGLETAPADPYAAFAWAPNRRLVEMIGLEAGTAVLDVGSGFGGSTALLAEAVGDLGRVIGVDASAAAVKAAREQFPGIQFLTDQADSLERVVPGWPAAITAFNLVHYLGDAQLQDAFSTWNGKLSREGRVALNTSFYAGAVPRPEDQTYYRRIVFRAVALARERYSTLSIPTPIPPGRWSRSPEFYLEALRAAGFSTIESEETESELGLKALTALYQLPGFADWALPDFIPLSERQAILGQAVEEVLQEAGVSSLPRKWLQIIARKPAAGLETVPPEITVNEWGYLIQPIPIVLPEGVRLLREEITLIARAGKIFKSATTGIERPAGERQVGVFAPSRMGQTVRLFRHPAVGMQSNRLLDLGSGDGDVLVAAAVGLGAHPVGIERDVYCLDRSRTGIRALESEKVSIGKEEARLIVPGQVEIREADFMQESWSGFPFVHYYSFGADVPGDQIAAKAIRELDLEAKFILRGTINQFGTSNQFDTMGALLRSEDFEVTSIPKYRALVFTRVGVSQREIPPPVIDSNQRVTRSYPERSAAGLILRAASAQEEGLRERQDDRERFLLFSPEEGNPLGFLAVVNDGTGRNGGHASEYVANRIASKSREAGFLDRVGRYLENPTGWTGSDLMAGVLDALIAADKELDRQARSAEPETAYRATSLGVLLIGSEGFASLNGDLRLYRVNGEGIELLTEDQSPVWRELDRKTPASVSERDQGDSTIARKIRRLQLAGLVREDANRSPLSNLVGHGALRAEQIFQERFSLRSGDRLVLLSDGVWSKVSEEAILTAVQGRSPEEAAEALMDAAAKGTDNKTALVIEAVAVPERSGLESAGPPASRAELIQKVQEVFGGFRRSFGVFEPVRDPSVQVDEQVGFLLSGEGLTFAPMLTLLQAQGVFPDGVFSGVVETREELDRLSEIFPDTGTLHRVLRDQLVVVEEQPGEDLETRRKNAFDWARATLVLWDSVEEVKDLQQDLLNQLEGILRHAGYRLPDDPPSREAARLLLQAA